MADLGAVTLLRIDDTAIPVTVGTNGFHFSYGSTFRTLSGNVEGLTTPYTVVEVRAHVRPTGMVVGSCRPNIDGSFSMKVHGDPANYYIVAMSPDGATYNAVISDLIASLP